MTLIDGLVNTTESVAPAIDRLLAAGNTADLQIHAVRRGALPDITGADIVSIVETAGIIGRGGGGYPTARKMMAVRTSVGRRRAVVIVNACEGDPTSWKDAVLASRSPHLVLDGAVLAARGVGAERILVAARRAGKIQGSLVTAAAQRRDRDAFEFVDVPHRFVASESSALVNLVETGDARPRGRSNAVWRSGVDRSPTLVDNAETLAQIALAVQHGPTWFRSVGVADEPGTTLVTVQGAVAVPGVMEVATGASVRDILASAGTEARGRALIGGLGGRWVRLDTVADVPFTVAALRAAGASRGVGSIVVLGEDGCVLEETVRIAQHLATESAGQCGPCMFGLPSVAQDLEALRDGDPVALDRLSRRLPVISGRGGCAHPDGTVSLAESALALLEMDDTHMRWHLANGGCGAPLVVPVGKEM